MFGEPVRLSRLLMQVKKSERPRPVAFRFMKLKFANSHIPDKAIKLGMNIYERRDNIWVNKDNFTKIISSVQIETLSCQQSNERSFVKKYFNKKLTSLASIYCLFLNFYFFEWIIRFVNFNLLRNRKVLLQFWFCT